MQKEIKTLQKVRNQVMKQEISDTERLDAIELRKLALSISNALTIKLRTPEKAEAIREKRRKQLATNALNSLYVYKNQFGKPVYCTYANLLAEPELKKHAKRVRKSSLAKAETVAEAGGWA